MGRRKADRDDVPPATANAIEEAARAHIEAMFQTALRGAMIGVNEPEATTTFASQKPLTVDVIEGWTRDLQRAKARMERSAIYVQVEAAHQGAAISHRTAVGALQVECSYQQAAEIHRLIPLRLFEVASKETAIFVPASEGELVSQYLPRLPYTKGTLR